MNWNALHAMFWSMLRACALGVVGSAAAAEDVAEATIQALIVCVRKNGWEKFHYPSEGPIVLSIDNEPTRCLCAWLRTVARNLGVSYVRKQSHYVECDQETLDQFPSEAMDPHEEAVLGEDRERANRVLAQLPERESTMIKLRFLREASYNEIATVCDMPATSVGKHLQRALQQFREYYARELELEAAREKSGVIAEPEPITPVNKGVPCHARKIRKSSGRKSRHVSNLSLDGGKARRRNTRPGAGSSSGSRRTAGKTRSS